MSVSETHHPDLQKIRRDLQEILQSASTFNPTLPKPPIIDSSSDSDEPVRTDAIRGLRALRDTVKRDLDVVDKFLDSADSARLPALSTNAPYLIAVWKEILCAPGPVTTIWPTFSETGEALRPRRRGLPKEVGVKVDVVAEAGKRWIRVNTTKNSRMLAEFRELDSYLTDSEDSDGDGSAGEGPSLTQEIVDNSLLRTGRALLTAARANPVPGTTEIPAVTLRLSRLDPSPPDPRDNDPRIALTIQKLRDMGIEVELGERKDNFLDTASTQTTPVLFPTAQVNLDLSILIALVSDLTHAPLPSSPDDANARFTPSAEYIEWKKKRLESIRSALGASDCVYAEPEVDIVARPSRALVYQALQEMDRSLLQDMFDRLNVHSDSERNPSPARSSAIQFWTTPEAKERCIQIVTKIGGPKERQRMESLFMEDIAQAEALYWQDSRYPKNFIPLLPIRLLPPGDPDDMLVPTTHDSTGSPLSPFFSALAKTCRDILRQETIPDPRPTPASALDDPNGLERAVVTKANPRLTAHTVQSLLWGALHGWTTLTANKTSVKAVLKEMRAAHNGALWSLPGGVGGNGLDGGVQAAALWTVDPRSLAEGMRADFRPEYNNALP